MNTSNSNNAIQARGAGSPSASAHLLFVAAAAVGAAALLTLSPVPRAGRRRIRPSVPGTVGHLCRPKTPTPAERIR